MNPACKICDGACCKFLQLTIGGLTEESLMWLNLHGIKMVGDRMELETRCTKLVDGKCSIYDNRPEVCKRMPVGSPNCLYAAKKALSQTKFRRVVDAMPGIV